MCAQPGLGIVFRADPGGSVLVSAGRGGGRRTRCALTTAGMPRERSIRGPAVQSIATYPVHHTTMGMLPNGRSARSGFPL